MFWVLIVMMGPDWNANWKIVRVEELLKTGTCHLFGSRGTELNIHIRYSHGRGPVFEAVDLGVSSCYEIGRRVFAGAKDLYVE